MGRIRQDRDHKTVLVARFLIVGVDGDKEAFSAAKRRWTELAEAVQRLTNDYHTHWLRLHFEADNHVAIRQFIPAWTAWQKAGGKNSKLPKPKCAVQALDKSMSNKIYHLLTADHPGINVHCLVLAMNKLQQRLSKTPASSSAFPRWMMILAGRGEFPSSSNPMPIPFDKGNAPRGQPLIVPKDETQERWKFQIRLDRLPRDGKPAQSTIDTLHLQTRGRRLTSLRNVLWQIAKGEWEFCGSDLLKRNDGWYIHLCYRISQEEKPALDGEKTAILRPGRYHPIQLRHANRHEYLWRRMDVIAHVRRKLCIQRLEKSQGYRSASSARKGHGRKRALEWRGKLERSWKDFVKTWNGQTASAVVRRLVELGIGRLVFIQPTDEWRDTRCLANAGKVQGQRDSTGWDWYQLGSALQAECAEFGIEYVQKKHHERSREYAST